MLQTAERTTTVPTLTVQQAAVLVAAPLVAITARLLATPVYQHDDNSPDHVRYLAEVAEHAVRNDVGGAITLVSAMLYAAAAVIVGGVAAARFARAGRIGGILAAAGAFGLAAWGAMIAFAAQAARSDDRDAMVALLDASYDATGTNIYYGVILLGALGWMILGVCLYRSRAVPRLAAVLTSLGGAAVLATAPGPLMPFIVGAAVVSLAGLGWVAAARR
ncbi:MAG TPA: DUF4386 family protein [Nocardioidaceae bacterium]|nr:DUF4386 family protein [Nocardioidaceae bacterium]